eukprot:g5638.t1
MALTLSAFGSLLVIEAVFGSLSASLPPIQLEARKDRPHAFVEAGTGREVIFHGTTAVVKGPPWHPDHTNFSTDISMAQADFEWMQKLGLNFLRLGVMWPGVEPLRGKFNETYLDQIEAVVALAAEHGVYVMLDAHQDGFSEYFCGEGVPHWAVKRNEDRWDEPLRRPFPAPYDKFENDSCFYTEPLHQGARFPTHQACDRHKHGAGFGESTFESAQAYQALWDNWNGTADAFAAMWAHVARRFRGRPEVVGLNLVNEPFAGDFYHRPLLMVPWPSPTNADRVNLQPVYDRVNAAVRAEDDDVLVFAAGVTWGDLGSGFSAAPGGPAFANRTVLSYHFYDPPQFGADAQVASHTLAARRLGTAAMMTETEAIWAPGKYTHGGGNITDACDARLQGWADWAWKSFVRAGPGDGTTKESQYYTWGAPKTGHGVDWNGADDPPAYYMTDLARTYAPRVAGSLAKMRFNATSSDFELQYVVGARALSAGLATEIFLWPARYPGGATVVASASAGSVRVQSSPTPSGTKTASTTRYWDCSKPTCAWCGKCKKAGDGDYAASWNQLFKGSDGKLYGTAATSGSLGQSNSGGDCKHCYELTFKDGAAKGKTLTLMTTNFCPDQPTCPKSPSDKNQYGEHYHFDIAIPGGGVGAADKCQKQYSSKYSWKANSKSDCSKLPDKLQGGCKVWWEELGGMDNPKADFKKVDCPSALSGKC